MSVCFPNRAASALGRFGEFALLGKLTLAGIAIDRRRQGVQPAMNGLTRYEKFGNSNS
jgi:hypothetical protein